jgi:NAD-dependent dihydropyrimidine dehydrogenase PreA subunit
MKTSAIGMVSAAILILVAGVGFGIAQAAGNQSYDPMLSFGDQDVNPYIGVGQAVEFCPEDCFAGTDWQTGQAVEFCPEDCFAGTDWQTRGAVETGAIPAMVPEEDMYRGWGPNEWGYNE